jgi:hypothetical protein
MPAANRTSLKILLRLYPVLEGLFITLAVDEDCVLKPHPPAIETVEDPTS